MHQAWSVGAGHLQSGQQEKTALVRYTIINEGTYCTAHSLGHPLLAKHHSLQAQVPGLKGHDGWWPPLYLSSTPPPGGRSSNAVGIAATLRANPRVRMPLVVNQRPKAMKEGQGRRETESNCRGEAMCGQPETQKQARDAKTKPGCIHSYYPTWE